MKFGTLIKTNSWISVETIFLTLFPDEINNIVEYEKIFNELKILEPIEKNISIVLNNIVDDFDNEEYVNVTGYYTNKIKESEFTDSLALEFTLWNEWLGMEIDQKTLSEFTEFEIICHCLFEMTFIGFDQSEIEEELERINGIMENVKNMSDEEKNEKLIPFEKVKERLLKKDQENQTPPNEPSAEQCG